METIKKIIEEVRRSNGEDDFGVPYDDLYVFPESKLLHLLSLVAEKQRDECAESICHFDDEETVIHCILNVEETSLITDTFKTDETL